MNGKQRTQISGFPGGALGFDCSGSSPAVVPSVQAISRQMDEPAQFRDVYEKTLEEVGFMTLKKGNLTVFRKPYFAHCTQTLSRK